MDSCHHSSVNYKIGVANDFLLIDIQRTWRQENEEDNEKHERDLSNDGLWTGSWMPDEWLIGRKMQEILTGLKLNQEQCQAMGLWMLSWNRLTHHMNSLGRWWRICIWAAHRFHRNRNWMAKDLWWLRPVSLFIGAHHNSCQLKPIHQALNGSWAAAIFLSFSAVCCCHETIICQS